MTADVLPFARQKPAPTVDNLSTLPISEPMRQACRELRALASAFSPDGTHKGYAGSAVRERARQAYWHFVRARPEPPIAEVHERVAALKATAHLCGGPT